MSIVSEILKARDQLLSCDVWSDSFAYVIPESRVSAVAEELALFDYYSHIVSPPSAIEIEKIIRAGKFKVGDIPLVVQSERMAA